MSIRVLFFLITTTLFTFLFYEHQLGINLLIYEFSIFSCAIVYSKPKFTKLIPKIVLAGTILSAFSFVINYSLLALILNLISCIMLTSVIIFDKVTYLPYTISKFFFNLAEAPVNAIKSIKGLKWLRLKILNYFVKIVLIPLLIIFIFLLLYYNASSYFSNFMDNNFKWIGKSFQYLFDLINIDFLSTVILGSIISILIFYASRNKTIEKQDLLLNDNLLRKKITRKKFNLLGLKNEYKSGVFLLIVLNIILVTFNFFDIRYVWFGFKWSGQLLKEFVHEGTYALIFSLLLSMVVILYLFRQNINFYRHNSLLKKLSFVWILQNILLLFSVIIRTIIYIEHFNLAHKRIGLIFFLATVLIGLITILIKVKHQKSLSYLIRINSISIYITFLIMSLFNWDNIIVKYNFNHYETAFIHFNYLDSFGYKSLYLLNKTNQELKTIDFYQSNLLIKDKYKSFEEYKVTIDKKIISFKKYYKSKSWLEWNYAEYLSYKKLFNTNSLKQPILHP